MEKFDKEELKKKNEVVDKAISVLKTEFVGIDRQIDEIMDNVRTWYLYPQLQTRPLVVSIWGMSGCGKTSLVKRISELLDIEKDFVYWNFASISESSSWEIENEIEEQLSNEKSNRMFVYDEFQYAATINPTTHEERDSKSGLKPFWELLDSGLIHKRSNFWNVRAPLTVADYMTKINMAHPMEIRNGVWVNAEECLANFRPYDISKFREVFNFDYEHSSSKKNTITKEAQISSAIKNVNDCDALIGTEKPKCVNEEENFFIRENYLDRIIDLHDTSSGKISDKIETYHKLLDMDYHQIINFIMETYEESRKGYDLKFNDSIIFVIGNLDEAYEMSFNVNPDMSPDQFKQITEEISIVDIKKALKNRFRNEQIARLGNIHVIYPSFSSKDFEDIISLNLDRYEKDAYNLTGIHLTFDKTIRNVIYDEGVFPTQGTRPIFSTIHEVVKSHFPNIVRNICENGAYDSIKNICYTFDNNEGVIIAKCSNANGENLLDIKLNVKLRLKKLRDSDANDDLQALNALHESGHFVMYAKLFGKMPEKLVSRTTDSMIGGFLMNDFGETKKKVSKKDMMDEIKVMLGGYVAEKMFFGEEATCGASSDLFKATQLASRMVRRYGMGSFTFATTNVEAEHGDEQGMLLREENQSHINRQIKDILTEAETEVQKTFMTDEWKDMLKESAIYLCNNSAMPKEKMQELYDKVADNVKGTFRSGTYYRDKIAEM